MKTFLFVTLLSLVAWGAEEVPLNEAGYALSTAFSLCDDLNSPAQAMSVLQGNILKNVVYSESDVIIGTYYLEGEVWSSPNTANKNILTPDVSKGSFSIKIFYKSQGPVDRLYTCELTVNPI